jgi:hypothetical protein
MKFLLAGAFNQDLPIEGLRELKLPISAEGLHTLCWLRLRLDYLVHRAACALLDDDLGLRGYRIVGAREMPVNPFLYRLARSSSSARIGTPRLQA